MERLVNTPRQCTRRNKRLPVMLLARVARRRKDGAGTKNLSIRPSLDGTSYTGVPPQIGVEGETLLIVASRSATKPARTATRTRASSLTAQRLDLLMVNIPFS